MRHTRRTLGLYLKNLRETAGLTQVTVAEKLGYTTPQFISNWERGLTKPPARSFKKLSKMYDVSTDTLVARVVTDYRARIESELR